jgi:hypothetical protein
MTPDFGLHPNYPIASTKSGEAMGFTTIGAY